ncbi:MAG: orotate phosphoribosyltransferase [Dehalococcoidia bacterium]|nr:orotate phosphoribosyltransferase [Dehalococcoidia bacterium]
MARQAELSALLREVGALMDGHFLLSSGRHSPIYVEKFRLLQHPQHTERLCRLIADRFRDDGPELVAGPTTGGVILSYEVARLLGLRGIFAEKADGGRAFQRGFEVRPGERTLIVDDVLTTGGSIREVIEAVRRAGGEPIGVAVLVDRSGGRTDFGLPFFACLELDLPTYEAGACPLCDEGVPLTVT